MLRAYGAAIGTLIVGSGFAVGLWVVADARMRALAAPGPAAAADALTLLLALAALLLLLWLALGLTLGALAVLPGAIGRWAVRSADRLTPARAARATALLLGSAVATAALPTTAVADPTGPGAGAGTTVVATAPDPGFAPQGASAFGTVGAAHAGSGPAPDPGFLPRPPVVRHIVAPTVISPPGGLPAPRGVVVHRGDTLWAIAARDLGPDATDAEVAAHWPRWFAANREVVGSDPDRILPGQVLSRPTREVTR